MTNQAIETANGNFLVSMTLNLPSYNSHTQMWEEWNISEQKVFFYLDGSNFCNILRITFHEEWEWAQESWNKISTSLPLKNADYEILEGLYKVLYAKWKQEDEYYKKEMEEDYDYEEDEPLYYDVVCIERYTHGVYETELSRFDCYEDAIDDVIRCHGDEQGYSNPDNDQHISTYWTVRSSEGGDMIQVWVGFKKCLLSRNKRFT
jgi:hypothetical protein